MIRLAIRCRAEDADRVLAELLRLVPGGVEEERFADADAPEDAAEEAAGFVEFAVYGPAGELPALPDLVAVTGDASLEITTTEIPDDWADRWRDFHEPVIVGDGRLVVRPSWERPTSDAAAPGREAEDAAGIDVVIEPGQAFGTGGHATTRMCLQLLLDLADSDSSRGPLVDLGTGSGVLAITAAKLGWAPVMGVDHEPAALEAAAENARANEVDLELRRVNLRSEPAPTAATLIANLTGPLLRDVAATLGPPLPHTVLCSGMLTSEAEGVACDLRQLGFSERRRARDGDWVAICFALP